MAQTRKGRVARMSIRQFLAFGTSGFIIGSLALVMTQCVTTSETHRKAFILVPDAQMNLMGEQSYQEIMKKEKLSKDKQKTEAIVRIGKRIAAASGQKFDWEFKLIDNDKTVNAFCLPGGKIAVYTGILPVAKTEAGLAAVMGHEVAHATLRHGAERVSQSIAAQAGLSVAALSFGNAKHRELILAGLGLGTQVGVLLPFSRKHESEADEVGLKYMAKAGYEPAEAVELWKRMAEGGGSMPEILSTHPDPLRRSKDLKNQIPKVAALYAASEKQPSRNF